MNIIERFGSYAIAKEFYIDQDLRGNHTVIIRRKLLEYRREHNMYEKGDYVIITQNVWGEPPPDELCYVFSANPNELMPDYHIVGVDVDISIGFNTTDAFRHATDNEIKNKRRD